MSRHPPISLPPELVVIRKFLFLAFAVVAAGCSKSDTKIATIPTATIARRDIIVEATATGVIEPINVVEVKSRSASGQVTKMPVEIGTLVKPGDLIVQLDTRDVQNQYEQAKADLAAAKANMDVQTAQMKRQQDLFSKRIITQTEFEAAQVSFANATSQMVRSQTNLDLAAQKLEDATVKAAVLGTVITKPVSVGQVIQAGASSIGGGSVIVTMADLTKVRARALVAETDIGLVALGQPATVRVDAFPDRTFRGQVEKVEPQAVVQQNVTMFPVLVSLENLDGALKPGMNGEVSILTDQRLGAIAVPNDAIRSTREARTAAALLGLNPDSVQAQVRAAFDGGFGNGAGGGMGGGGQRVQVQVARGILDLPPQGRFEAGQGGGGFQMPQVTDADCKKVDDATKKKPAVAKKIDDLRAKMREGGDRQAIMSDMRAAYQELGVDMMVAAACRRQREGGGGPQAPGGGAARGGAQGGQSAGAQGAGGQRGSSAAGTAAATTGGAPAAMAGSRTRSRPGLVFVQKAEGQWEARVVRLGVANYDYTEVLDGLKEGEKVAMLSVAALQAQRQAQNDRMKAMTGSPLGGGGAAGARPGGGAGGGGAPAGGAATRPRN